ncbi:MAG: esterase/lipase family protein, partial [Ardenticatenaceae bacterium]
PEGEASLRSTRSLGRTVKLYLFKVLDWKEPSLGLHSARFVPEARLDEEPDELGETSYKVPGGEVRYRELRAGEIAPGQRVALFVHGFSSDTPWMVSGPATWFAAQGIPYDHVLTFDYESFGTRISENGQTLANALRAAGFGPDDGLHLDLFAHSMGTLVSRAMIELWGGDEFVDRAFLAGAPNLGTRLAEGKRLITWLGTVLLNKATPTPPTLLASWALKKVSDDGVGVEDLHPTAEWLRQLNSATGEARVPYYILAGGNEIPEAAEGIWNRLRLHVEQLADTALDFLFGEQNDLVISLSSMKGVRNGNYPNDLLKSHVLPCNHFEYFGSGEGREQLLAWLAS